MKEHKRGLLFVIFVGLSLSIANALWAFLLSIAESLNGNFALVAIFMAFGLIPVVIPIMLLKKERFHFNKYAALTGILYGVSNAILLSIFSYKNSAVIYSLISPTIIVFILFEIIINRSKLKKRNAIKLFFGGCVAGIGFIVLSFSGLNLSLMNSYDIAISLLLIFLYGAAGFFFTQTGLKSRDSYNAITNIGLFEALSIAFFLPFSPHIFSFNGIPISFLAGIVVSIGVIISFFGYHQISHEKHAISYSSIIYILSEMETLFLLLFYSIFVGELNTMVILSIFIISISVWYLSKESDTAFS